MQVSVLQLGVGPSVPVAVVEADGPLPTSGLLSAFSFHQPPAISSRDVPGGRYCSPLMHEVELDSATILSGSSSSFF